MPLTNTKETSAKGVNVLDWGYETQNYDASNFGFDIFNYLKEKSFMISGGASISDGIFHYKGSTIYVHTFSETKHRPPGFNVPDTTISQTYLKIVNDSAEECKSLLEELLSAAQNELNK